MGKFVSCPNCSGFSCTRIGSTTFGNHYRCDECGGEFVYQINGGVNFRLYTVIGQPYKMDLPFDEFSELIETLEAEPDFLRNFNSWMNFKKICQIFGLGDPWGKVFETGKFDITMYYADLEPEHRDPFILSVNDLLCTEDIAELSRSIHDYMSFS